MSERIDERDVIVIPQRGHPPLRLLRKTDRNDPGATCADCGADHSESSSDIYHRAGCPSEWRNVR